MASTATALPSTHTTPPPVAHLVPLVQGVLRAAYSLFRFVFRATLVIAAPLNTLWPLVRAVLSPITVLLHVLFEALIFTPCTFLYSAATALHPLYIFLATACISGATVGLLGRYAVAFILGPNHSPKAQNHSSAPFPLTGQTSKKRKRRSVRLQ